MYRPTLSPHPHLSYLHLIVWCDILILFFQPSLPRVEANYPVQDPKALQDQRVASLIQYSMKVEKAMFETATSQEEYYQLVAEKIYRIRKELEERRKAKNKKEKRTRMGGGWHLFISCTSISLISRPEEEEEEEEKRPDFCHLCMRLIITDLSTYSLGGRGGC